MTALPLRALNLLLFPLEVIAATFLFVKPLQRRKLWWLRLVAGIAVVVGACFLFTWLKDLMMGSKNSDPFSPSVFGESYILTVAVDVLLVLIYVAGVYAVFKTDLLNVLYIGCASFLTQNIAQCIFFLFFRTRDPSQASVIFALEDPINIVAYLVVYVAVYLLSYFVFARKYENATENELFKRILLPLIFIILINILMDGVNTPKDNEAASSLYMFLLFGRICLCVMGLAMQFIISDWYKVQFEQSVLQQIMYQQKEQYRLAKDSIDTVNINAHDLKKQINIILKAVRESGKTDAVENEITDMIQSISVLDTTYRTGNKALDVTLAEKSRTCLKKKIKLSTIADGGSLEFMSDIDIYALFGNALDNAIEATERIENEDDRIISFSVRKGNGVVFVHVENTFVGTANFVDGIPQTIKKDKRVHGFGVKSIMNIAKKYGGNLTLNAENGLFYLDVILPLGR